MSIKINSCVQTVLSSVLSRMRSYDCCLQNSLSSSARGTLDDVCQNLFSAFASKNTKSRPLPRVHFYMYTCAPVRKPGTRVDDVCAQRCSIFLARCYRSTEPYSYLLSLSLNFSLHFNVSTQALNCLVPRVVSLGTIQPRIS